MEGTAVRNVAATALVVAVLAFVVLGPGSVLYVAVGAVLVAVVAGQRRFERPGLAILAVVNALVLFVLDFFLHLAFSFGRCGSDTSTPDPGSDIAAYCDTLRAHDSLVFLILFGPPLFALAVGLVAAQKRQPNRILFAMLAGLALTIVVQIPGWIAPG
jgi:cation transporter-like permease